MSEFLNKDLNSAIKNALYQYYIENNDMYNIVVLVTALCYNRSMLHTAWPIEDNGGLFVQRKVYSFVFEKNFIITASLGELLQFHSVQARKIYNSHVLSEYYNECY